MYNRFKNKGKGFIFSFDSLSRDIGKELDITIGVYKCDSNTISRALLPTGVHNLDRVSLSPLEPLSFIYVEEVLVNFHNGGHCAGLMTR